jgi:flagellar biosynthesis GTPase FlhF
MKPSISVKASLVVVLLSFGLVSLEVGAQTLMRLTTESQRIPMNTPVTILLEYRAQDPNWCGVTVDYGNGSRQSIRIGHEQDTTSPIRRTVTFSAVGTYTIRAEGTFLSRGLKSAQPCQGSVQPLVVTVFDLAAEKEKERAEAQIKAQLEAAEKARQDAERERERVEAEARARLEAERQARVRAEEAQRQSEEQKKAIEARELELKRKELELREQALRREEAARRQSADRKPATEADRPAAPAPAARPPVRAADGF